MNKDEYTAACKRAHVAKMLPKRGYPDAELAWNIGNIDLPAALDMLDRAMAVCRHGIGHKSDCLCVYCEDRRALNLEWQGTQKQPNTDDSATEPPHSNDETLQTTPANRA